MIIHIETFNFALFVIPFRFYDKVNDKYLERNWRIRLYGKLLGNWKNVSN